MNVVTGKWVLSAIATETLPYRGKWVMSAIATETLPYRKVGVECNTETGLPYCIRSCMPMTAAVIRGDKFTAVDWKCSK